MKYWNEILTTRIAKGIGKLISIQKEIKTRRRMIDSKFYVNIDITKNLRKKVFIDEDNRVTWKK